MWASEVEPMDTSDFLCWWYYLADCGRWHRFEDDPVYPQRSENIEKYYLQNSKLILNMSSDNYRSKIDFSVMLQTDLTTGQQRRIQRSYNIEPSCSCFSAAPVFWEGFDPAAPYQLIKLNELTPEYKTVASYAKHDGFLNRPVVSISRIQNLDLWEMYCRKKKQLMRIQGVNDIAERRLFHGTDTMNVESICMYNFDLRLAGQHGSVYGKGTYFTTHASLADKFSSGSLPSYGGLKVMFLARVIVGKSVVGQHDFIKPDHGSLKNTHDSCVDDLTFPKIFVIFDSNQIYPEYLIQYD